MRSSGYDSLDLCCFEVTNARHKSIIVNNVGAGKLYYCDQELQWFYTTIVGSLAFVICIVSQMRIIAITNEQPLSFNRVVQHL